MSNTTIEKKNAVASLAIGSSSSVNTDINVDFVTADTIGLSYNTLTGNQPNTYGNFVSIWQNSNAIPWNTAPLATFAIPANTPSGSLSFPGLNLNNNSYIVGYSVGQVLSGGSAQKYGNICNTAFIPKAANPKSPNVVFDPSMTLDFVGTNSVAFDFNLPDGVMPLNNAAWVGIWRNSNPSYNNPPDLAVPISLNASSGTASINNYVIGRGLTYTIGLFMSGFKSPAGPNAQTALACSLTFTNS